ncbi:MAG: FkbM family methyltransferase [Ginsengibacter sp.]
MHLPYSKVDYQLNAFLTTHLLRYNAFLLNEDQNTYTSDFYFGKENACRITLRKPPSSDFAVYDQIFVLREYDPLVELIKSIRSENVRPLNIIDAGGNIGLTSIFLNNPFPGSRFGIIEPDLQNFKILEKNINQNNFSDCMLINGGLWNKNIGLKVNRDFRDGNDWSVNVTESEKPTELKGFSIPTLMEQLHFDVIDILKIDIEGSEKQLFSDPDSASEFLSKTKYIAIEIHDEFECRDHINDCLTENNFEFFLADGLTIGVNKNLV